MIKQVTLKCESASLHLSIWNNERASIRDLYSEIRRKGHATKLLRRIVLLADVLGLTLILEADAYGLGERLDNSELERFYEKFGFVIVDDGQKPSILERVPKSTSQKKHGLI